MRKIVQFLPFALLLAGCGRGGQGDEILSEHYLHDYGHSISREEFDEGFSSGRKVTLLRGGITLTSHYEEGRLHGLSTQTFPHSKLIEISSLYHEGVLIAKTTYDLSSLPLREEKYLSPEHTVVTSWYHDGVPMSCEEYIGGKLSEGHYMTHLNEEESSIQRGEGKKISRDSQGLLLSREEVVGGEITKRDTFHPNGSRQGTAYFSHGQLHGEKREFTAGGEPLSIQEYLQGKLHGKSTFFKQGAKSAEVYYLSGMKNGPEIHYVDGGMAISQEIFWNNDEKYGPATYYSADGVAKREYYHEDSLISEKSWKAISQLDEKLSQE